MELTHLHFDCYSGLSGDMTLGALADLGVDAGAILTALKKLDIGPLDLRPERVMRQGVGGTRMIVEVEEEPGAHRHLHHVIEILERAGLPERASRRAAEAYRRLAQAEAHVHGSTIEKVHFHEVGARDAIVDIAGAMLGIELLGATAFSCSTIRAGGGTVTCRHGVMPVPAPATAELLKGLPWAPGPVEVELATPTGIAILATLLAEPGSTRGVPAELRPGKIGYGAGSRELPGHANYLRLMLCEGASEPELPIDRDRVVVLEAEIDDMSPELGGHALGQLMASGALDAHFIPAHMKKRRPGFSLRVIARPEDEAMLVETILRETTSFGVRRSECDRWKLPRRIETVDTAAGPVEIKIGLWDEEIVQASPEFESCREAAIQSGMPLRDVMNLARAAALEKGSGARDYSQDES